MGTWYTTGTVTIATNTPSLVGTGTAWTFGVQSGDAWSPDGSNWYEVTVVDDTHITLTRNYTGGNLTTATYMIMRNSVSRNTINAASVQLSTFLSTYQGLINVTGSDRSFALNKLLSTDNAGMILQQGGTSLFRVGAFGNNSWQVQYLVSSTWTPAFNIDPTTGAVSFGGVAPTQKLDIVAANASVAIYDNQAYATGVGGAMLLQFQNSAPARINGAEIEVEATTGTAGAEVADMVLSVMSVGTLSEAMRLLGSKVAKFASTMTTALGIVTAPAYAFTGDIGTGMWSPAASTLAWSVGGAEKMRLSATGLGIGTSGAAQSLSIVNAAVGGAISTTPTSFLATSGLLGSTSGNDINIAGFGANVGNVAILSFRARRSTSGSDWTTAAMGILFDVDSTPAAGGAIWFKGGNIGIAMVSPARALDVTGTFGATGNATLSATTVSTNTATGALVVTGGAGIGGALNVGGNVGIGVTPLTLLFGGNSTNKFGIEPRNDGANIDGGAASNITRFGGYYSTNPIPGSAIAFINAGGAGQRGAFAIAIKNTDDDTNQPVYAVVVDAAGKMGIGTTSPATQLHTTGSVRFANFGSGTATFDASGNLSSVSDERLKHIDGAFRRGLADILNMDGPVCYHWLQESEMETEHEYVGFTAQGAMKGIPEAGSLGPNGYYSLNDRAVLAATVNAIRELSDRIGSLEIRH